MAALTDKDILFFAQEYPKFRKAVIKKFKFLEGLVDDAFDEIHRVEDAAVANTEEALDHAKRAERAVRRLKKELEE